MTIFLTNSIPGFRFRIVYAVPEGLDDVVVEIIANWVSSLDEKFVYSHIVWHKTDGVLESNLVSNSFQ